MAWFITKHASESALEAVISSLKKPNLAMTADDSEIHYVKRDYSKEYLTFETYGGGITFGFTNYSNIQVSYDEGATWQSADGNGQFGPYPGNKVLIKGSCTPTSSGIGHFSCPYYDEGAKFKVYGNAMSLLYGDNFEGKTDLTGKDCAFMGLFSGCTLIENAKYMSLPATTLSESCYQNMFMFCTSLTTAPALPATLLTNYCYRMMFKGCSSLDYIKMLAIDIDSASDCLNYWVEGVSGNGTFVKNSRAKWTDEATVETVYKGVPLGWTIQTEESWANNGYEYVDLGLPSGTKWATMNVGASSETDYGNYYQYGKGAATLQTTSGQSNYAGIENPLALTADTASRTWGGEWHTPTSSQAYELSHYATSEWVENYQGSGVNGCKFTGQNGKVLFIPAAGYYSGDDFEGSQPGVFGGEGTSATIWGSTPGVSGDAYTFNMADGENYSEYYMRDGGYSVRPVMG